MKQSADQFKKKPIKSPVLNFEHPLPIKIYLKSKSKDETDYKFSHTINDKMHKSSIINSKKNIAMLVNSKSKNIQNIQQNLRNSASEHLSQYNSYRVESNKSSHVANIHKRYNFLASNREQVLVKNLKKYGHSTSSQQKTNHIKEDMLFNKRQSCSLKTKIYQNKQFNPFETVKLNHHYSKSHKNKRFKSVYNEINAKNPSCLLQNINSEVEFRDIYKINKINLFDYDKISKHNSPQHKGIGKFYQFCNQKKPILQFHQEEKIKDGDLYSNQIQNSSQSQSIGQIQPQQQFKPYHKQSIFEISNKLSPNIRKKRLIVNKKAEDKIDIQINKKGLSVRLFRKKENTRIQREWLPNISTIHEDFVLEGWKEQAQQHL